VTLISRCFIGIKKSNIFIYRLGYFLINYILYFIGIYFTIFFFIVSVYPFFPSQLGKPHQHSINIQIMLEDLGANLNLSTGRAESPLPGHTAILVDIDVFKVFPTAPNREVVFETLDLFRGKKNDVFESCITDKARELFGEGK